MNLMRILQSKGFERFKRSLGKKSGIYLKLKKFRPSVSSELRTAKIITHQQIDLVIDIGANTGQFAESLYDFGYKGKVISFEPGSKAYLTLVKQSKKYKGWTIAERCAIGSEEGTAKIHVSKNSVFSSLLKIKKDHVNKKSDSTVVEEEEVKVFPLDSIIESQLSGQENILLKIDTQGYEKQVLDGARSTLKKVRGIKIEIPLFPIYQNTEFSFYDIIEFLKSEGFKPYSFEIEGVDPENGRVNTIDGLFFRD